ncbi:primosomal protein N' [Candidatus Nomurabacteria bacterium]|nr:primosomal protein N' [Candidatus Nomurabacteria bacterium]
MYLIQVVPFAKNFRKDSLSYFSSKKINIGSIVTIELRNKNALGLVIKTEDLSKEKENLKSSKFKLKKIKGVTKNTLYQKEFVNVAFGIADYFASTPGNVLQNLTSAIILDGINKLQNPKESRNKAAEKEPERFILQSNITDRFSHYKNLIRGQFVKNKSVIAIFPTTEDVLWAEENLSKGIENYAFILHSGMTKKQVVDQWNKIIESEKPIVLITTPIFLGVPRHDIGCIILDKESSSIYKIQKNPYLDIRMLAEDYAKKLGAKFVLGDIMMRTETLWRFDNHQFEEFAPMKFRSLSSATQKFIDMTKDRQNGGEMFAVLSNDVISLIKATKEKNEQTFLFAGRRGLAPTIICGDCGTVVQCNQCTAPVVLHGKDATKKENFFKCHVCGDERSAGELCRHCNSWKLRPLGIGVGTTVEAIKEKFPDQKVFVIDSDNTKTARQARQVAEDFYDTPGSVLVGTEMALLYLKNPVENTAIVSIDSLLSLPDFAIRERVMRILLKIRNRATQNFFVQTRRIDDPIFELAIRGNLSDFYRDEFIKRKQFNYPPFSLLIKISLAGKKYSVEKEFEKLKEYLEPTELIIYPAFTQEQKGKYILNGLIKINPEKWIDQELHQKLMSLPPQYKVVVGAQSLL